MISPLEMVIRLLAAALLCGTVGLSRALAGKAAGMRTHILVGVGAALFTLVSGYAFHATAANADRIAAQIVSGIGFIGGGAILKEHGSIKGLTTAANLWAAAALGMAAGAGLYAVGVAGVGVILFTLVALRGVEMRLPRRAREAWTVQVTLAKGATLAEIRGALTPPGHKVALVALQQDREGETRMTLAVALPHHADLIALTADLRAAGAHTIGWQVGGNTDADRGDAS